MNDLEKLTSLTKEEVQNYIADIEREINLCAAEKVEIPVDHHFSKDVYAREIKIPKGTIVIGKIHKFQNLNILSKGTLLLLSIDGAQTVKAPFTVVSSPGVKRLAVALEDSVWTTIHGTDETDVDKIEELFIAKSYDEVELCHGSQLQLQALPQP